MCQNLCCNAQKWHESWKSRISCDKNNNVRISMYCEWSLSVSYAFLHWKKSLIKKIVKGPTTQKKARYNFLIDWKRMFTSFTFEFYVESEKKDKNEFWKYCTKAKSTLFVDASSEHFWKKLQQISALFGKQHFSQSDTSLQQICA